MSICDSGIGIKLFSQSILINVPQNHSLIILANQLPWVAMYDFTDRQIEQLIKDNAAYQTF